MNGARALVAALCLAAGTTVHAKAIDFTSQAGLDATCPPLLARDARTIARDDERIAWAICSGIDLARDAVRWLHAGGLASALQDAAGRQVARERLESYLARLSTARRLLEGVKGPGPYFVVAPGEWAIDFDGDGHVSIDERHFLRTPRPGATPSPFSRAASEADYQRDYISPVVNVDRADVLWALAYCDFAEAALNLVLSYDFSTGESSRLVLVDAERVRTRAYPRLLEGLRQSARLREALLAETDDDREWIGNPRQRNTSFPIAMDAQTFATWGEVLAEGRRIAAGKALLGGSIAAGERPGLTDLTFGACPAGLGIDVRDLFIHPVKDPLDPRSFVLRCTAPTAAKSMSRLAGIISASIARNAGANARQANGEWQVLRNFYWIN